MGCKWWYDGETDRSHHHPKLEAKEKGDPMVAKPSRLFFSYMHRAVQHFNNTYTTPCSRSEPERPESTSAAGW